MDQVLQEVRAALARILVLIKAYERYSCLNLDAPIKDEVDRHLVSAKRRRDLLETTVKSIEALLTDRYPSLPRRIVNQSVIEELTMSLAGMQQGLKEFDQAPAAILEVGPEEEA